MVNDAFLAECVLLRAIRSQDGDKASLAADICRTFISDAADRISAAGKSAINGFAEGDDQRLLLLGLKRFTKVAPFNTVAARRRVSDAVREARKYPFA
jgi:hypothetical protein